MQRAAADVAAAQSRAELAQAVYDQSADLQKNGVGTGIDTLRGNVQLQNEKQRVIQGANRAEDLAFRSGSPVECGPRIARSRSPTRSASSIRPTIELDQTIEKAYATRPELKAIHSEEERAALSARSAADQRLPKVEFSGFWRNRASLPTASSRLHVSGQASSFPLFTGGRIQAERAKAAISIRQLQQQEIELRNRIALEVKNAAAQVEAAQNEVTVANAGIALGSRRSRQARDRFQAGVANNIEVITAQDELARANDNQIAALYRYNQARANLAYAAGQMEALYAK